MAHQRAERATAPQAATRASADGAQPVGQGSGLLHLQRLVGNAAVENLLAGGGMDRAGPGVLDSLGKGAGEPLDPVVRADMESRLGADFADVRIHTGTEAAASAAQVSARAYTAGNEIVFGAGAFDPDSSQGRHRLAHELTHVSQQRRGPVAGTDTGKGFAVSDPGDSFEQAAEAAATKALSAPPPARSPSPGPTHGAPSAGGTIQRDPDDYPPAPPPAHTDPIVGSGKAVDPKDKIFPGLPIPWDTGPGGGIGNPFGGLKDLFGPKPDTRPVPDLPPAQGQDPGALPPVRDPLLDYKPPALPPGLAPAPDPSIDLFAPKDSGPKLPIPPELQLPPMPTPMPAPGDMTMPDVTLTPPSLIAPQATDDRKS